MAPSCTVAPLLHWPNLTQKAINFKIKPVYCIYVYILTKQRIVFPVSAVKKKIIVTMNNIITLKAFQNIFYSELVDFSSTHHCSFDSLFMELLIWTRHQMQSLWCQFHLTRGYTDCYRRNSLIEFHVLCPGGKKNRFVFNNLRSLKDG